MRVLEFGPFRLDVREQRLWRGEASVELRPKTWELLRHFAEHPGRLLSKDELLDAVWSDVEVGLGSLSQAILELRRALGDEARKPHFIETVHRRGFRFIAPVRQVPPPAPTSKRGSEPLPGRERELEQLDEAWHEAREGRRQIVFVTGEPGIGKTRLVRSFLERLAQEAMDEPLWTAGGTCVELHGEGEAYFPILQGLDHLAREAGEGPLRRVLERCAPSWLLQIPWLLRDEAKREAHSSSAAATRTSMLRQFCIAVEELSAERPLLLWLEDLHWSDPATLDLLAALAARSEPARLFVLATYRPVDAAMGAHPIAPLKRKLVQQDGCRELALELLDETGVGTYLRQRFAAEPEPALTHLVHEQTDGNPLFMVTLVDHLLAEGLLARPAAELALKLSGPIETLRTAVPKSLRGIVEAQLDGLGEEELTVLTAASAVGETFAAQAVAGALDQEVLAVEKVCGRLAGWGRFLEAVGAGLWPDGSAGERFCFHHAVIRDVLYRRSTAAQRQAFHHRIATRLEQGHAGRLRPVAAELAMHCERGGDAERAVPHLIEAAAGVRERAGDREALAYFDRALALLSTLPESEDRDRRELELRMHLWREVNASMVVSATDQDASLEQALELCDRVGDVHARAYVMSYRTLSWILEGRLDAAASFDAQRVEVASRLGDPIVLSAAHDAEAYIAFYGGELDRAQREYTLCLRALEGIDPREPHAVLGHDPAVLASGHLAWTRWLQGHPDQARAHAAASLARAEAVGQPLNQCFASILALFVEQLRRDTEAAVALAKSYDAIAEEHGFELPYPQVWAGTGWTHAHGKELDAAVAWLRRGISVSRGARTNMGLSALLATLAEAELARGAVREGLTAIDEALAFVEETGERFFEAEVHRLKGELLLRARDDAQVEACFERALDVARRQGARALELRAATHLARLWKRDARKDDARRLLAPVYDGFREGLETADLRDAQELLESL